MLVDFPYLFFWVYVCCNTATSCNMATILAVEIVISAVLKASVAIFKS